MDHIQTSLDILQDLIRFDTQNPPGKEQELIDYIVHYCTQLGINHTVHTYGDGRANILITLGPCNGRSLTVLGHVDVVHADVSSWTYPPFAAEIHDGFLWGRGTLDMKYMVAVSMTIMRNLKAIEHQLKRQVHFLFTADEETGSSNGIVRILEEPDVREAIAGSVVLNEGGGFAIMHQGTLRYLFETGQKSVARVRVTIQEFAGTNPYFPTLAHEAVLVDVLDRMQNLDLDDDIPQTIAQMRNLFIQDYEHMDSANRKLMETMSCSMVTPTIIHGGARNKHIPEKSRVTVDFDCRLLPNIQKERFVEKVRQALHELPVTFELTSYTQGYESHVGNEMVSLLQRTLQYYEPAIDSLVPFITPGSNDGKYLRSLGCEIIGFAPLHKDQPFSTIMPLIHGVDERISLRSIEFCEQVLHDVILEYLTGESYNG
jgi:acetylornithine deacetylase/succinyl-diaminopimelate desuccinylase-like protein